MNSIIRAAFLAAATSLAVTAITAPASAQVGVSLNFGDVAIGYQDGYYDSHHHWHHWHHRDDYKSYQTAHPEHYRDYTHDRDEHPH